MPGSAVTRLICAPWAGVNDLPTKRPDLDDDVWDDLLWQASETLYSFTARQFSGGCESYAVLDDDEPGASARRLPVDPVASSGWAGTPGRRPGGGAALRGRLVVGLPGPYVTEVLAVLRDGVEIDGYRTRLPAGRVWPTNGRPWPGDGSVAFRYRHGRPPPIGGRNSVVTLALEYAKAMSGGRCNLPRRVESIAREGVTISMLNSFQMIGEGRTGVYEIDLWLREVNPQGLTALPSVWSPDVRRARRSVEP